MRLLRKPDFRYPVILAIVSLILWAPRLRGPIDLRWDAGVYYILGTSLAEGNGYRLLNEPGEIHAVQYPPGLPALVAVEQKVLGTQNTDRIASWLRRTYCAMFLIYILGAYAVARQFFRPEYAFIVGLICALSGDMLYLSDLLQAELPFAMVTVLFVLCARPFTKRATTDEAADDETKPPPRESPLRFAMSSVLAIATYLLRSAGIALMAAWIGEAIFNRRWRAAALRTAVAIIPVISWQSYVSHIRHSPEYNSPVYAYQRAPYQYYNVTYAENLLLLDSFKPELGNISLQTLTKRTLGNVRLMPARIGESVSSSKAFFGWTVDAVNRRTNTLIAQHILTWHGADISSMLVGFLTVVGGCILLRRRQWFIVLYLAATVLLIVITPWPKQFLRYLSTVAPFLALCTVMTIVATLQLFVAQKNIWVRKIGIFACCCVLVAIPMMEATVCLFTFRAQHSPPGPGATKLFYMRPDWISWNGAIAWINDHLSPGDVIASSAPHIAYLDTGHKSVLPPMEADPDRAMQLLDSIPVRYVVVGSFDFIEIDQEYMLPMIHKHPEAWKLAYTVSDGMTRVYERVKAP